MRSLFPRSVNTIVQGHALARFGMTEILDDVDAVQALEPDANLLGALLGSKSRANPALTAKIREVAKRVVDELAKRLRTEMMRALANARRPGKTSRRGAARDIAWTQTIRANLKNYDAARRALIADGCASTATCAATCRGRWCCASISQALWRPRWSIPR